MKSPQKLAFGAIAVALALSLGACSAPAKSSGTSGQVDKNTSATISYGYWDEAQKPALEQDIAAFNKQYPKIKVNLELTPYSSYFTKLQTQAQSKNLPDVFWMNGPNFQLYASSGMLEPMTSVIKSGKINPKNYPDSLDQLYTYNGVQYGIPKDYDTIGVWYNKAIFAQAGVPLPSPDWTWADFQKDAKAISDKLKPQGIYGVVTTLEGGQEGYYNTILQAGGQIISKDGKKSGYDSPAAIKGIQFWTDLIANGSSPTVQQLSDTKAEQWFTSGKAAMFWSGSYETPTMKAMPDAKDVNVINLPKGERQATVIHGLGNVVSAYSKNKDAAMTFATFLGSKQAEQIQGETGTVIPAYNGTQDAYFKAVPGFDLKIFGDEATNYAYPYPASKNTAAWNTLENNLLPKAFSGQEPVAQVCKELADQMNKALAAE